MTKSTVQHVRERASHVPPPFQPDPEIIGNIEGNKRRQEQDRAAARKYLREHGLAAP